MSKLSGTSLFVAGIITTLVLGGTAYAANGGVFRLGESNSATKATTLNRSNGTPLVLNAPPGKAPLAVNRGARVANLNADKLDGVSSESFGLASSSKTGFIIGAANDADHFANTAKCPSGTKLTGGGGLALNDGDYIWYSGPDVDEFGGIVAGTWLVAADGGAIAFATCYNPRGSVPGAVTNWREAAAQARAISHGSTQKPVFGR